MTARAAKAKNGGGRIVVINPNSTQAVTDGMSAALEPLRFADGPRLECLTLKEGPPGIETDRDVDSVVAPLCRLIAREDGRAAAFVIACFSDPGLRSARETTRRPVFGIAESGITAALNLGDQVGIISILPQSVARHARYFRALGVAERIAGDLPVNIPVVELKEDNVVFGRLAEVGRRLKEERGADVLVLGCAGMAGYRQRLQANLKVPVVEPTQAAAAMAILAVQAGL